MDAPCKDCTDRKVGCHGSCDAYQEFNKFCEDQREKRRKKAIEDEDIFYLVKHHRPWKIGRSRYAKDRS